MKPSVARVVHAYLSKMAGWDLHEAGRDTVKDGVNKIQGGLDNLLRKLAPRFKANGFALDLRQSHIEWEIHGSDGIRLWWELYFTDRQPVMRTNDQVQQWLQDELDVWGTVNPKGSDQWHITFGDY